VTDDRPRWLLCRRRRPEAALRLYCFPHSGGSPGEYLRWSDHVPGVELWAVQLPGRGSHHGAPHARMDALVDDLVGHAEFTGPMAFFGHSLGSLVAYETAVALRDRGLPGPRVLYVSAHEAPHLHRPGPRVDDLDHDLVSTIEQLYGPLPPDVVADPDLLEMVLTTLRADLSVVASYRDPGHAALDAPVVALGGAADRVTADELRAWRKHTTGPSQLRMFPGGHFYFRGDSDAVQQWLAADLAERAAGALPRPCAMGPADAVPGAGPG
jgi:surfactin synthase thioesterase subunit